MPILGSFAHEFLKKAEASRGRIAQAVGRMGSTRSNQDGEDGDGDAASCSLVGLEKIEAFERGGMESGSVRDLYLAQIRFAPRQRRTGPRLNQREFGSRNSSHSPPRSAAGQHKHFADQPKPADQKLLRSDWVTHPLAGDEITPDM